MGFEIKNGMLKKHTEEPGVEDVTIPASVTVIGRSAFENCTSLESVTIPNSLMQISEYAFYNCKFLTSVTFCGCTVDKRKWDWDKVSILDVKAMLDSKDYSVKMDPPVKYMFVTQVFLNTLQSEAEAYIKKNTLRIIKYFIDNDDYKTVKGLFECGKFVTKRNIMKLVEHSIAHTQNGGDMQIQAYIMDYNNKHFPNTDPFNNIKI